MKITEILPPENVQVDLAASSKQRLLQILSEQAGRATGVSERTILEALRNREKLGSTGVGLGIALPHAPVAGVSAPYAMLARLAKPVDFDSIDEIPADIVVVLLTPANGDAAYLNVLACIARRLRSKDVLQHIRSARSDRELYAAISDEAE